MSGSGVITCMMRFLLVVFMLASAEAMLKNCQLLSCPASKTVLSSSAYTVITTPSQYREGKPISVIVTTKRCPANNKQQGPEWFRLDATDGEGNQIGKFVKPSQRSEDRGCEDNSLIIFHTCEPLVIHDLPRKYLWRPRHDVVDREICFTITLYTKGETHCEVIKKCVPREGAATTTAPTTTTSNATSDLTNATIDNVTTAEQNVTKIFNETITDSTTNSTEDMPSPTTNRPTKSTEDTLSPTTIRPTKSTEEPSTDIIDILIGDKRRRKRGRSKRCRGCPEDTSDAEKVCGSDGITYDSKCHLQRAVCIERKEITEKYRGNCRANPPTLCERSIFGRGSGPWYSGCNCSGHFKPRQCYLDTVSNVYKCWCSDEKGFQDGITRYTLTCSEKMTEITSCF